MATRKITLNEGMSLLKQLRERHSELVALRDKNGYERTRYIGANASKEETVKPTYDVKALDVLVNGVACENPPARPADQGH